MTLIAEVFPKLQTPKNMVTSISKKSSFKGSFPKQHDKRSQMLFKFPWQHLYHIYWSMWRQLNCKKSLLLTCKISRLFPNTPSADCKYSLLNRANLTQPIQMHVSRKQKTSSQFFAALLKCKLNFEHFQKKRWAPYLTYFRNYGPRKTSLDQCRKSPVPRDPSESNMVNLPKHCWNIQDSSFTIFIDHC